ncbi:MAG: hypothetical protein Q8J78_16005 [Moraxellaceae bacterium]|nr:hypothetical protein [Moraxellaceae bacterium]
MMPTQYSVACFAMDERDVALIKSLMGIINKGGNAVWTFADTGAADVLIVDTDNRGHKGIKDMKPKAIIAYSSPDNTLIPNTFVLTKPARARELMDVLDTVRAKIGA